MNVDIPDLDEVEFETRCSWCRPYSFSNPKAECIKCSGAGTYVTQVGKKLIEFLARRGINLPEVP